MNLRRMVIEVEVLFDADIEDLSQIDDLGTILKETVDGSASGTWDIKSNEQVSKEQMAKMLEAQGSDPEFLIGGEDLS